jgi:hypothetical protein
MFSEKKNNKSNFLKETRGTYFNIAYDCRQSRKRKVGNMEDHLSFLTKQFFIGEDVFK